MGSAPPGVIGSCEKLTQSRSFKFDRHGSRVLINFVYSFLNMRTSPYVFD